jgi:hypothetical protein
MRFLASDGHHLVTVEVEGLLVALDARRNPRQLQEKSD